MTDDTTVFYEAAVDVVVDGGREDAVDDHWEDRNVGRSHGVGEGKVDCGVLQWCERSIEHRLGERAEEVASPRCDLAQPFGVTEPRRAVALIQRV